MTRNSLWAIVIVSATSVWVSAQAPVVLEHDHLLVEFSAQDGSIIRLRNKKVDLELVKTLPQTRQPWALLLAPLDLVSDFTAFRILRDPESPVRRVDLEWRTRYRITVKASVSLQAGSDELELRCSAENSGDRTIIALRYPAIQGIGALWGDGQYDRLLHSTAMGALFTNPFHLFQAAGLPIQSRGMVISRYPNGFHGSPLQMMAYFTEGHGGFYVAAKDSLCTDKDLNFYKSAGGNLECEIAHIQWEACPGRSLVVDYPVVIAALTEGTWYEAAERYRAWATQQPWCRRGTRRDRVARADACRWLHEEVGAVGAWWPFRGDIRAEITRTRRLFGTPLLHLELWWQNRPSLEAAQAGGDRFGPFYFPFLALKSKQTFETHSQDRIVPPATPISPDWVAMCPAQPGWRAVVCESAQDMASKHPLRHHQIWVDENTTGCQADCLYYDVGPCAGVPTHCYAANHAHAPGAGRDITQAYVTLFEESQRRASLQKGSYVPVGTECVSEPFVGCLDLYYARNAGFNPDMEVGPYVRQLTWLPDGRMEIVPLFEFVYHDYGPAAIQGIYPVYPWNVPEADDFFTWAEARSVLWGGLLVTFPVASQPACPEDRTRFIRSLVAARTDFAREFLTYGRMQRPPIMECETLAINHGLAKDGWFRRIRYPQAEPDLKAALPTSSQPGGEHRESDQLSVEDWAKGLLSTPAALARVPTIHVPAVISQAFTLGDERLGILLVNLHRDRDEAVRVSVNPGSCGLRKGSYELRRITAAGGQNLGIFQNRREAEVQLPPRDVVLLAARFIGG
ncbi:MAG: hypothetical protein KA354_21605 [Phycisphaerae bacterium]|nr:hypothetical protein [Phycisphaerae bacterium]